jgi:hypothetical protein
MKETDGYEKLAAVNWFRTEYELADKTIPVNRNETCLGVARVPDQLNGIYITK